MTLQDQLQSMINANYEKLEQYRKMKSLALQLRAETHFPKPVLATDILWIEHIEQELTIAVEALQKLFSQI